MSSKPVERILYVEDDDDIREMLSSFLTGEGYSVSSYRTAEEALDALARDGCDLLLTDYVLPGEDAAWLLREARARGVLRDKPVVVVSAEYRPPGIEGATFLRKPVQVENLLETIDAALRDAEPAPRVVAATTKIELVLYVATPSLEAEAARRNLGRILRAIGPEHFHVVVRDICRGDPSDLHAIEEDRIVVVPTLVKRTPGPKVWIAGDLSKREYVADVLSSAVRSAARQRRMLDAPAAAAVTLPR